MVAVRWSAHAVRRARERCGQRRTCRVPYRAIRTQGERASRGETWRVHRDGVTFVCGRTYDAIVIITVYAGGGPKT